MLYNVARGDIINLKVFLFSRVTFMQQINIIILFTYSIYHARFVIKLTV